MLIKITSSGNIKAIKFNINSWQDPKLADIYYLIPECDNLTLWINKQNCGTRTAIELLNYIHQQWISEISSTKTFKRDLKSCLENGF